MSAANHNRRPAWREGTMRWIRRGERMLAAWGVVLTIYLGCFDVGMMVSGSMSPTLKGDAASGDVVLSERLTYGLRRPRRWELIRFRDHDGFWVIKRVVGLPGETIGVVEGKVIVNGKAALVPDGLGFLRYYPFGKLGGGKSVECAEGYFVLGDDSFDSQDSRYDGPVLPGRIWGRPLAIVWSPGRIGLVNP